MMKFKNRSLEKNNLPVLNEMLANEAKVLASWSCKDRSDETEELAWKSYGKPVKNARLYIPSKHFKPDVTLRYLEWWKLPVSGGKDGNGSPESSEISVPNFKGTNLDYCPLFPPGFTPKCQCIEVLDSDEEDPTVEELLTPNKKLKIVDHGINGDGKTLPATAHSLLSFSAENNDVTTIALASPVHNADILKGNERGNGNCFDIHTDGKDRINKLRKEDDGLKDAKFGRKKIAVQLFCPKCYKDLHCLDT
ncbi:hypothetical protein SADUNF_Sadunf11G0100000 [Salix dunnii]|uniref:Uncharacterized protein n=1 Tax=Salix dunnii TaxID=1413687 RepID=A0A835JMH2_9ROSI|nr:hypothetical protein SADUNF_Sadunf11G0100000 [Salix dunnii]